jgi:hypothetical protein
MAPYTHSDSVDVSFGQNYAVLNLDWMTVLIDSIKDTADDNNFSQIAPCGMKLSTRNILARLQSLQVSSSQTLQALN